MTRDSTSSLSPSTNESELRSSDDDAEPRSPNAQCVSAVSHRRLERGHAVRHNGTRRVTVETLSRWNASTESALHYDLKQEESRWGVQSVTPAELDGRGIHVYRSTEPDARV